MLSLTKKTDYALVALACLAQRAREGAPPVSAHKLADEHSLPAALTANILKDLHTAKIVESTRGPQGGYALTQTPDKTTLLEVVTAIEGPIRLADCSDDLPILGQSCQIACKCPIRDPMRRLNERLRDFFASVTLADLFENKLDNKVDVSLSSLESTAALRHRRAAENNESSSPETPAPGWLKVTV